MDLCVARLFARDRPILPQNANDPRVMQLYGALKEGEQRRRKSRPTFSQEKIIAVLNSQPCGPVNKVNRIQQFLQVQKVNVPGMILGLEHCLQCSGGAAVSTTCVVKNDREVMHCQPPARSRCALPEVLKLPLRADQSCINFP